MADEIIYNYDGKFEGNILVEDRTGCGKTTFVQNLGTLKKTARSHLAVENTTFKGYRK